MQKSARVSVLVCACEMAMACWGIPVSAAGDYRPFQLLRDPYDGGRAPAGAISTGAIQRTSTGAAIDGRIRAREAIEGRRYRCARR